jgi:hypothetical protein
VTSGLALALRRRCVEPTVAGRADLDLPAVHGTHLPAFLQLLAQESEQPSDRIEGAFQLHQLLGISHDRPPKARGRV